MSFCIVLQFCVHFKCSHRKLYKGCNKDFDVSLIGVLWVLSNVHCLAYSTNNTHHALHLDVTVVPAGAEKCLCDVACGIPADMKPVLLKSEQNIGKMPVHKYIKSRYVFIRSDI